MADPGNTLSTALRIGNLSTLRTFTDFVGTNDLADVYQFNVTRDSLFNLTLGGLRDDIAVSLVFDANNNGVWDSGEDIVTVGDGGSYSTSDRVINKELATGTYFVWVFPDREEYNSNYTLSLSARTLTQNPVADPGETFGTALSLGNLSSLRRFTNLVGTADLADVYRFNLTRDSLFNLTLGGLRDDIAVSLVFDANNNGVWDSGEDIVTVGDGGSYSTSDRVINKELATGSYFVWVFPDREQYNSSYNLSLSARALVQNPTSDPGETLDRALNLGNLSAPRRFTNLVGTADLADVYRFNLTRNSFVNISLTNLNDDIAVSLIVDNNNNGVYDDGEDIVTLGDGGSYSTSDRIINQELGAGTYFVWIFPDREQYNSSYKLELSARVTTPSNFDDYIVGTFNNDTTNGLGGNDYLFGEAGNDRLTGGLGSDTLLGDFDNDTLIGETGNDILNGGAGIDSMVGGVGNDSYYINTLADVVVETSTVSGEIDSVYASISYRLGANVERLFLTGTAANGTGNNSNNFIFGNAGNNRLDGGNGNDVLNGAAGKDTLIGNFGNDTLIGGAGNDILLGGVGIDSMVGGVGSDIYYVNTLADVVVETSTVAGEIDSVYASISYSLGANVERLFLTGTAAINGTGNNRNNFISGNAGNNAINGGNGNDVLNGEDGNDTLIGGAGNDILLGEAGSDRMIGGVGNDNYYVNTLADVVVETSTLAGEIDSVYSSISYSLGANVERLFLTGTAANATGNNSNNFISGNAGNNILVGGSGNDTLIGAAGNDTLIGSVGNDTLTGGAGSDRFVFQSRNQRVDRITDFNPVNDFILVSARGFGGGLVGGRALASSQFRLGSVALDGDDRFIYNQTSGALFFDADGNGTAFARVAIASLTSGVALTSADIFVTV
jgi:Ca2+-binding RTX toxin-like protein